MALTYHSKIKYDLDTDGVHRSRPATQDTETDVDTPQSVTLDFQTGVAPKTLVFGYDPLGRLVGVLDQPAALRGRRPRRCSASRAPLVDYADDWWTYNLGVGRQLTDALAGSFSLTYEPDVGGEMTSLGPYDGRTTGTAALTYEVGQFDITGGLTYGVLGDTENLLQTDYNDGSVWGAGLRVGYTF